MNTIIIVNGPPGVGKDTFVDLATQIIYSPDYSESTNKITQIGYYTTSDMAKQAAALLGWDTQTKDDKIRLALSNIKDLSDEVFNTTSNYLDQRINSTYLSAKKAVNSEFVIFIVAREPKDIQRIVDTYSVQEGCSRCGECCACDVHTVLIDSTRPDFEFTPSNHADSGVYDYNYDWVIYNDGTVDDFKKSITAWLGAIGIIDITNDEDKLKEVDN